MMKGGGGGGGSVVQCPFPESGGGGGKSKMMSPVSVTIIAYTSCQPLYQIQTGNLR